jgi:lipoate-protein ligase A
MKWRIIDTEYNNAFFNMAVDEALLRLSKVPTLRFYAWKPAALSLGYFQSINDINLDYCKKNNISVVRRITGGKAVFHDKELTYSFVIDEEKVPRSVVESYKFISKSILIALNNLGVNANFKENIGKIKTAVCLNNPSWYEIVVENKKIAAAAQTRKNKKLLQHGPILVDVDYERLCSLFNSKDDKKLINETKKRITSLNKLNKKITYGKLSKELKKGFEENFNIKFVKDKLNKEEEKLAEKLIKEKYKTKEWNYKY